MVRTRAAVSPTGYPHIGTMYQALFDSAFAKREKGSFVLRIEDTDRERFVADAEERIYIALDWFGLVEDESTRKGGKFGPYAQSERLPLYQKYAKELLEKGDAYYCFCSKEQLEEDRRMQQMMKKPLMYAKRCLNQTKEEVKEKLTEQKPYVIRMKIPAQKEIICKDEIRGDLIFTPENVDDQVILKSDGFPTYHLASVVDDHLMEITHLVRGEEWIPSFPKHVLLYRYFGWEAPLFFHTPTLRNPDKSKLSKRHGHTSVSWYQEEGYLPDAILNFLALLGWSHPEGKEIFSLAEFTQLFDLKDIKAVGPIFDLSKLTWMNQQYIQSKTNDELKKLIIDFYPKAKELPDDTMDRLMDLVKTRMETLKEFEPQTQVFFDIELSQLTDPKEKELAQELYDALIALSDWNHVMIFAEMKKLMQAHKVRMSVFYKILTGSERGLPLPEVIEILGKEKTLSLLKQAL